MNVALAGPADHFAELLDRMVRRAGGPGNLGQLVVRTVQPPDPGVVASAWTALRRAHPLIDGRWRRSLRGVSLGRGRDSGDSAPPVTGDLDRAARAGFAGDWRRPPWCRLVLADGPDSAGCVLTWDHRFCDARSAMSLLRETAEPPATAGDRDRCGADSPRDLRERGRLAREAGRMLHELDTGRCWRPPRRGRSVRPVHRRMVLAGPDLERYRERQRRIGGRFGETAFFLAAFARACRSRHRGSGHFLFPMAVDERRGRPLGLGNHHGFQFLRCGVEVVDEGLAAATAALTASQRDWLVRDGSRKLLASFSFVPWVPDTLIRTQLGQGGAGLAASSLVANTGPSLVPDTLFGVPVLDVRHGLHPPAHPGLALLCHRFGGRLVFELIAVEAVARALDPEALVASFVRELLEDDS